MVAYLTNDEVMAINKEVLSSIKVKKADSFKVLSHRKLNAVLEKVAEASGDVYDKAVALLKGISQEHPFASGNRRTSMVATVRFLRMNGEEALVKDDAKILQGVRESYYTDAEIKQWLKGGDMREFKR
ncbi:type II toxin-antitoxin system death-on-curing family toxin [Candidatus Woesearchaeota archaeon]|nr:type II toxin-antitoxin system death-on-curing family toxin [Candidatus Woesearchaeota archaeon]